MYLFGQGGGLDHRGCSLNCLPLFLSLELFHWLLTLLRVNVLQQSLIEDVLLLKLPGEVCVSCLHFLVAPNTYTLKAVTALSRTCFPVDSVEAALGAEGFFWWFLFYKIVLGTEAWLSFAFIPTSQSS